MTTHDLTRRITPRMPGYPDDPPVEFTAYGDVETDGYRATELHLTTHSGTHVDAPAHTEPDGRPIDAYPPEAFRFDALRLDVAVDAPRQPITADAVRAAARDAKHAEGAKDAPDADPEDAFAADVLVLDTGWADHWDDDRYADHPYLTPDAAEWIGENGYSVGIDALSVDPTPTVDASSHEPSGLPAHHALLGHGLFVIENLTNLGTPPPQFRLEAYPLPIRGGDAAPARVVAEV